MRLFPSMDIEGIGEELGNPISFQNLNPKSRNQCPLYKGRLQISGISITVSSVSITHMILVCPIFPMEINNPCSESLCQDLFAQKPSPPSLLAKLVFLGPLFNFPPPYLSQPSTTICNHLRLPCTCKPPTCLLGSDPTAHSLPSSICLFHYVW